MSPVARAPRIIKIVANFSLDIITGLALLMPKNDYEEKYEDVEYALIPINK